MPWLRFFDFKNATLAGRIKIVVVSIGILLLLFCARPCIHLCIAAYNDVDERKPLANGYINDASKMMLTQVAEVYTVPVDQDQIETQLRDLLQRATQEGLKVSIGGARHSMGGHTIYPGGIHIDTSSLKAMSFDSEKNILTVQSGALWSDVIRYLDGFDKSVAIMQSNNSFSIGGSISVNCHGWQYNRPPISSSVKSFRIMLSDGSVKTCTRTENSELFSLVLGGYGLFGIILDVTLEVVDNGRYKSESKMLPIEQVQEYFEQHLAHKANLQMLYGRLDVSPDNFLKDCIVYAEFDETEDSIPKLQERNQGGIDRSIFRGSVSSDYGKNLRWSAENNLRSIIIDSYRSRNSILSESVEVYANKTADTSDIIHEYFVPRAQALSFVHRMQEIIPAQSIELINVTVRIVNQDTDTFMRFAHTDMIAFVLLLVQNKNETDEQAMQALTQTLIDAALDLNGSYFLPYRLHASQEQFHRSYPQAKEFFKLKRKYDPNELFQNMFYLKYGNPSEAIVK